MVVPGHAIPCTCPPHCLRRSPSHTWLVPRAPVSFYLSFGGVLIVKHHQNWEVVYLSGILNHYTYVGKPVDYVSPSSKKKPLAPSAASYPSSKDCGPPAGCSPSRLARPSLPQRIEVPQRACSLSPYQDHHSSKKGGPPAGILSSLFSARAPCPLKMQRTPCLQRFAGSRFPRPPAHSWVGPVLLPVPSPARPSFGCFHVIPSLPTTEGSRRS